MNKLGAKQRKLLARQKGWRDLKTARLDTKPRSRLDAGGYKCPGSMK